MNSQKFYDMVETLITENMRTYSLILGDQTIMLAEAEALEEEFNTGEFTLKDLKHKLETNLITNQEYAQKEYGVEESRFKELELISYDLCLELKWCLEHNDELDTYKMDLKEFCTYMISEVNIFGDVNEKVLNFIDYNRVWDSLLRFEYSEIPKVGYVYTSI